MRLIAIIIAGLFAVPLQAQSVNPPALTGAEIFTLEIVRDSGALDPEGTHTTSAEVMDEVHEASTSWGKRTASVVGEAVLHLNWARAVLRGDSAAATQIFVEIFALREAVDDLNLTYPGFIWNAKDVTTPVRSIAIRLSQWNAVLSDSSDPEGFIRQNLNSQITQLDQYATMVTEMSML